MFLPEKTKITTNESEICAEFNIDESLPYLEGHFDKKAVLPGVVQIGWAIACVESSRGIEFSFHSLKSIKFTSLVLPPTEMKMTIKFDEKKGMIKFQSHTPKGKCASGIISVGQ